jgi:tRNA U34 5-carboxymethylaminomethyl modifying enzyme MnmG/GidA
LPIKRDISCLWTWRMENVWSVCQWFSTSLPADIQFKAMKSIAGFQDVKFLRAGYAIEYDYFPPTQLRHTWKRS